jgi:hypothetical protein
MKPESKQTPDSKQGQAASIRASSQSNYRERVLQVSDNGDVSALARRYWTTSVEKQIGEAKQTIKLRADVERIVVDRQHDESTILSPDAALTGPELALLSAEPYVPALRGLLPTRATQKGDQWQALGPAASELTGVSPIQSGGLNCVFYDVKATNDATVARINFSGNLTGPTEQGPARMTVEGHLLFDLDQQIISYLVMNGRTEILNPQGRSVGKLEGRYELKRRPAIDDPRLTAAALEGLELKASRQSTALLFDGSSVGLRFLYPRNWELASFTKNTVQLKEPTGGDMRLTIDSTPAPTAEKLRAELLTWLKGQKATVRKNDPIQLEPLAGSQRAERFSVRAEHERTEKEWTYLIVREGNRSVAIGSNFVQERVETLRDDVLFIARSLKFIERKDEGKKK